MDTACIMMPLHATVKAVVLDLGTNAWYKRMVQTHGTAMVQTHEGYTSTVQSLAYFHVLTLVRAFDVC
jgi:hypothetical protein